MLRSHSLTLESHSPLWQVTTWNLGEEGMFYISLASIGPRVGLGLAAAKPHEALDVWRCCDCKARDGIPRPLPCFGCF